MKKEEIKKKAEEYESKFTYSLAIARHFEEGAKWALSQPQIIEIFGKRVKIVEDNNDDLTCVKCCFLIECRRIRGLFKNSLICKDANNNVRRYFVEVDEDGNEIKQ